MARILLIRPYFLLKNGHACFPMGLAYLAGSLREANHEVKILDFAVLNVPNKEVMRLVNAYNPDLVGVTAITFYYKEMKELCNYIEGYPVVIGGIHPTSLPELTLTNVKADYLVIGEGERTIVELVDFIQNGGDINNIKGLAYKSNGKIITNEPRENIRNIDDIPYPAWDLLDLERYDPKRGRGYNIFFDSDWYLPVISSRGCPSKCKYCASTSFWGESIRIRTVESVIEEIEYLKKHYKIKNVEFWDDNFTISRRRVIKFCKEVIKRDLRITFYLPNGVKMDTLDRPLIRIMKAAGFKGLAIAIETSSQEILKNVNKNLDVSRAKEVTKILNEEGILTAGFFILGLPGENYDTIRKTIKFGADISLNAVSYFFYTPLPGSQLFYEWSEDIDLSKTDFKFDYMSDHLSKIVSVCDLNLKEIQQFQKLAYIYYIFNPKNFWNYFKRLNMTNIRLFIQNLIKNGLFLLNQKINLSKINW